MIRRATRAPHGRSVIRPIELVTRVTPVDKGPPGAVRIVLGDVLVGCDVGTDVQYVALLVRALLVQSKPC